jgi:hypothetical protein
MLSFSACCRRSGAPDELVVRGVNVGAGAAAALGTGTKAGAKLVAGDCAGHPRCFSSGELVLAVIGVENIESGPLLPGAEPM